MRVFDSRPEVVRALEAEGAIACPDLPSLARECDAIFVCVPTSAIVREVVFGKGGLAEGLAPGKIIVNQTTGDPTITREIAVDLPTPSRRCDLEIDPLDRRNGRCGRRDVPPEPLSRRVEAGGPRRPRPCHCWHQR